MASGKIAHRVSFIIPALNEERVIEQVTREVSDNVGALVHTYEIILVDDGSTDSTGAIMDRLVRELPHARVLHNPRNLGLGAAYWRGVSEARYDYVMMLNGDGGLVSLPPILEKIGTADIVIPYVTNLRAIKTPFRYFVSRSYTSLLNILSGQRLNYYNGLPVHRRALLNQINLTSTGFGYSAEILVKLLKAGCTFVEVGAPGNEVKHQSSAFRIKNVISVGNTVMQLLLGLTRFEKIDLFSGQENISPDRIRPSDSRN